MLRRVKFILLISLIGIFYLTVTLLAISLGLIAEACQTAVRRPMIAKPDILNLRLYLRS